MMTAYQAPSSGTQQLVIRDQWLTVRLEDWPGAVVVHVAGEIDLCTAPTLSTCLTTQLENSNPCTVLVINLADVSFLSCAGLRVLLNTQHVAAAHNAVLSLVNCPPTVHRLLEVLNLRHQFQLYPSLTDALPWLVPETTSPSKGISVSPPVLHQPNQIFKTWQEQWTGAEPVTR